MAPRAYARIALLADRLRVEERMLLTAFEERGHEAALLPLARLQVRLSPSSTSAAPDDQVSEWYALAVERGLVTSERAVLAALLASEGQQVVNRAATARLLADRVALLRHLVFAGIPVPAARVSFDEEATFAAIDALGYPVILSSLSVDPNVPIALVEDRDAAEAIVEHRTTLGGECAVLVQRFVRGQGRSVRLAVVGDRLVGTEERPHGDRWRPSHEAPYAQYSGDPARFAPLARRIVSRLGTGIYAIEVIEASEGPTVVGISNLVDFRGLAGRGIDVAGMIADYALAQLGTGMRRQGASEE